MTSTASIVRQITGVWRDGFFVAVLTAQLLWSLTWHSAVGRVGVERTGAYGASPFGDTASSHFNRMVDATRWLDSVTAAIETGTYVDPRAASCPLGEYVDTWLTRRCI